MDDRKCINEYLRMLGKRILDERTFEIVTLMPSIPPVRCHQAENTPLTTDIRQDLKYGEIHQLSEEKLKILIGQYSEEEKTTKHSKGRRFIKKKRLQAEKELEKRNNNKR